MSLSPRTWVDETRESKASVSLRYANGVRTRTGGCTRARVPPRRLLSQSDLGRENLQEFGLWTSGRTPSALADFGAVFVLFGTDSLRPLFGPILSFMDNVVRCPRIKASPP